jgi:hypothetical protein
MLLRTSEISETIRSYFRVAHRVLDICNAQADFANLYFSLKSGRCRSQTKIVERAGMLVSWQICLSDAPSAARRS